MIAFHAGLLLFYQREKMSIHTWVGKMPLPTDVTTLRICLLRLGSSRRDGSSSSSSAAAAAASLGHPNVFFLPWHTSTFGKGDQQPFFPLLAFCTLCFFRSRSSSNTPLHVPYLTSDCLAAPSWLRCKEKSTGERESEKEFQVSFRIPLANNNIRDGIPGLDCC